jgi:hypothetical protein
MCGDPVDLLQELGDIVVKALYARLSGGLDWLEE